uniref:Uncharacterized LOC101241976 n=1 Tax=Ciona intestinalis TaxID=7719 RepID=F6ZP88_CIOIN
MDRKIVFALFLVFLHISTVSASLAAGFKLLFKSWVHRRRTWNEKTTSDQFTAENDKPFDFAEMDGLLNNLETENQK